MAPEVVVVSEGGESVQSARESQLKLKEEGNSSSQERIVRGFDSMPLSTSFFSYSQ